MRNLQRRWEANHSSPINSSLRGLPLSSVRSLSCGPSTPKQRERPLEEVLGSDGKMHRVINPHYTLPTPPPSTHRTASPDLDFPDGSPNLAAAGWDSQFPQTPPNAPSSYQDVEAIPTQITCAREVLKDLYKSNTDRESTNSPDDLILP